jgi:hypothetical protein
LAPLQPKQSQATLPFTLIDPVANLDFVVQCAQARLQLYRLDRTARNHKQAGHARPQVLSCAQAGTRENVPGFSAAAESQKAVAFV